MTSKIGTQPQPTPLSKHILISAIGTPLDENDDVHASGLLKHLEEQYAAKIDGVLVAGTMGLMQLLSDNAYRDLATRSSFYWKDKGELLIGVGDASFARTRDRMRFVNTLPVDGTVVLAPYFFTFSQAELIDYYLALAAESRSPLFLYDLPQRTRTFMDIETVLTLSEHPNIAGIKCSGDIDQTKLLIAALRGSSFRVIVAQPTMVDSLLREGINEHLDGMFSIVPKITRRITSSAARGDWTDARSARQAIERLLSTLQGYGVFPAMTAIMNARGIEGRFGPRPTHMLSERKARQLMEEPSVIAAINEELIFQSAS